MKLNQELIQQLRNGEIAVENNGTLGQLREVLNASFPKDERPVEGNCRFYLMNSVRTNEWDCDYKTNLPIISVADFYETELFTGWAKDDEHPKWMIYFKNDVAKFGFGALGDWLSGIESAFCKYSEDDNNRPATHEEIERHLIQEAKRRGFKNGVKIKSPWIKGKESIDCISDNFVYYPESNELMSVSEFFDFTIFKSGQWAEIVEEPQPEPNPIHYVVDDMKYSLDYQGLKRQYKLVVEMSDEKFMAELPKIAHLACIISYFKGLSNDATIGDKGIVHELIHLMVEPNEPTNDLQEIRKSFNEKIKLV